MSFTTRTIGYVGEITHIGEWPRTGEYGHKEGDFVYFLDRQAGAIFEEELINYKQLMIKEILSD